MRMGAFMAACAAIMPAAAQAQVPNTFVAGTPAKAAEVNENFQALDARITANEAAIAGVAPSVPPLNYSVVASNSEVVGPALLAGPVDGPVQLLNVPLTVEGAMGSYHIIVRLSPDRFEANQFVYFAASNCTGVPHLAWSGVSKAFSISHPHAINKITGKAFFATGPALTSSFATGSVLHPLTGTCDLSNVVLSGALPAEDTAEFYTLFPPPYATVAN